MILNDDNLNEKKKKRTKIDGWILKEVIPYQLARVR